MDVTLIGAGRVATALGEAAQRAGHDVRFLVRDVDSESAQRAHAQVPSAEVVSWSDPERPANADLWILATPASTVEQVLAAVTLPAGAVLADATNAFAGAPDGYATMAAVVGDAAPSARIVKAFNVVGAEHMADPKQLNVFLPIASDDPAAAELVREFAASLGFDAVVVGGAAEILLIEDLARLWGAVAFRAGLGRDLAFSLTRGRQ